MGDTAGDRKALVNAVQLCYIKHAQHGKTMIDKAKLEPNTRLTHKMLGDVVYTDACHIMERYTGNSKCDGPFGSLFVEHENDVKEVSLTLLSVKE